MNHGGTDDDDADDEDDDADDEDDDDNDDKDDNDNEDEDDDEDGDAVADELINGRAEYEEMRDDLLGDAEQLEEEVGFGEIMINQVRMVMKMERMMGCEREGRKW